ncbi:MAG: lipase family protein [Bacteroidota bacterium]
MNKNHSISLLLIILSIIIVTSCKKTPEKPDYDYFISKELAVTYTTSTITGLLSSGVQQYPELSAILQYVKKDVSVYKIVYTTEVNGESIDASGLVCVPAVPGEYPVISFQNGTNTVNAYAPSEFVINPSYQLVEFIASMGFIVVIPDYPGFGKSKQIPHPYLIAEPTVQSIVDMLYAVEESCEYGEFTGITTLNEYYLIGYSQGGWATLALHKTLELEYNDDFELHGSVCGAGPYNLYDLLQGIADIVEYPMPYYLGYIINAYSWYHQFTNPVSDLLNEPYASRISTLYIGTLSGGQINEQLSTSTAELFRPEFITGFAASPSYSSVREALINNSISAWNTSKPILFVHGEGDTHVSVTATHRMFDQMLGAGTSPDLCSKIIYPGLDHGDAIVPAMIEGLDFIFNLIDE